MAAPSPLLSVQHARTLYPGRTEVAVVWTERERERREALWPEGEEALGECERTLTDRWSQHALSFDGWRAECVNIHGPRPPAASGCVSTLLEWLDRGIFFFPPAPARKG